MLVLAGILSLVYFIIFPIKVNAVTLPTFPNCTNTQGVIKSSYPSGTHGIAGTSEILSGSDVVFTLTHDTLTQCFCSIDGNGIQTNWWKVSSLLQSEIDDLKNLGWITIANGALWGLEESEYLAQNSNYGCIPNQVPSEGDSNNNSPTQIQAASIGEVLVTTTKRVGMVLGLADTGGLAAIYIYGISGIISIGIGCLIIGKPQ